MVRKLFLGLFSIFILAGFFITQVNAAELFGRCPYGGNYYELPDWYYSIAYEVYNNGAGISTEVVELRIDITADLTANVDTVNIILTGAKFNQPAGWTFVLLDSDDLGSANIVGQLLPGSTLDNLGFTIITDIDAPASLYLGMLNTDTGEMSLGAGLYVSPGLNPSCTVFPDIKVAFTAPNESAGPMTLAKIYPAHPISIDATTMALTAELNADVDFKEFLGGPKVVDALTIDTCGTPCAGGTCEACYRCELEVPPPFPCERWIAGSQIKACTPTFNINFELASEVPEPGVKSVKIVDEDCSEITTDEVWKCSASGIELVELCLEVKIDGITENNPTIWSIKNLSVSNINFCGIPVQNICLTQTEGNVGAWYGGVEAIVPFVKKSDVANTYIKLFNRYNKDAKLFAEVFNQSSGKIIVALKQIPEKEYIPARGMIEITADDLMNLCPDCDWNFGQAVKFLVRVPSQTGCLNVFGDYPSFTACYNNPYDPYIEGIVVSIMNGEQRSVPLLFKYFKQGAYNQ